MTGGQTFDQADDILQEKRNADGRDQRHEAWRPAQGAIGHPFHRHRQGAGGDHPGEDGEDEKDIGHAEEAPVRNTGMIEGDQDFHPDKGADGKDFAVGEIDKFEHAIDHGVAQGDGGIDKADGQPVNHHLGQIDQGVGKQGNIEPFHEGPDQRRSGRESEPGAAQWQIEQRRCPAKIASIWPNGRSKFADIDGSEESFHNGSRIENNFRPLCQEGPEETS